MRVEAFTFRNASWTWSKHLGIVPQLVLVEIYTSLGCQTCAKECLQPPKPESSIPGKSSLSQFVLMFYNLTLLLVFAVWCPGFALLSACVMLSLGACQPQTSKDGLSQYSMTSKTSVHGPHGIYLSGTFLLDRELSDWVKGENLPSWTKKQWSFSLKLTTLLIFDPSFPTWIEIEKAIASFSEVYISAIQIG